MYESKYYWKLKISNFVNGEEEILVFSISTKWNTVSFFFYYLIFETTVKLLHVSKCKRKSFLKGRL